MKSVLISIQPKWCELIASGKKTVEVRKTKPKLDTPFKCYIYCTKKKKEDEYGRTLIFYKDANGICEENGERFSPLETGKVIGEFVCDKIYDITPRFDTPTFPNQYICGWEYGKEFDCLSFEELTSYLNGKQGFGWHISDLVIYENPMELSEFYTVIENADCENCRYYDTPDENEPCNQCEGGRKYLTRPPQSWCYVESEDTE